MNLVKLIDQFHSEDACREYLERLRWPDGVYCNRCGNTSISRIEDRHQYECNEVSCRYQFTVTAGTIFHDSKLPLWKWFMAIYLVIESKKGISAAQLGRTLGVTYKTAWYLSHRVRAAVCSDDDPKLRGAIEMDETFVGGKKRMGRKQSKKAVVIGAVQRGGQIRLQVIPARDKMAIRDFIKQHTDDDTDVFYTDSFTGYIGIDDHNTFHVALNHRAGEYVIDGDVHTNSIENVWSLLKRSIVGSFHKISIKHLNAYLDELEWRFNNRENPFIFRDTLKRMIDADSLQYAELIA